MLSVIGGEVGDLSLLKRLNFVNRGKMFEPKSLGYAV